MKRWLVILLILPTILFGQSLKLSISKNPIAVGEQFRIDFIFEGDASNFRGPTLNGLRKLSGPNQSSSSSMQIINGKVSRSKTTTYSYYVTALNEGSLTIGQASVTSKGQTFRSQAEKITVLKANPKTQNTSFSISENVVLKSTINRSSIFQGEQIVVSYKLYSKINLADINLTMVPELNGFWKEEVEVNSNGKIEIIDGVRHKVWDISRFILTPQKSGTLKIDPMAIDITIQVKNKRSNDPFGDPFGFFGSYQTIVEEVSSKSLTVNVKDLPPGAPANFTGAVGQFTLSSQVDKTSLDANQAVNYKLILSGNGNLHLIDNITVSFPSNFEAYDPQKKDKTFTTNNGIGGKIEFEHLLIPRFKGEYIIEEQTFNLFDPKKNKYPTIFTSPITINVLKGQDGSESYYSSEDLKENSNLKLAPIEIQTTLFTMDEKKNYSFLFTLLLLLPLLGLLAYVVFLMMDAKNKANPILRKYKKSLKIAQKRLKKAQNHLENSQKELFFEEIEKSLWSYFSNKFNVNSADLSKDTIHDFFRKKKISIDVSNHFTSIIEKCEFCRFAPASLDAEDMNKVYELATKVIIDVEQDLKK